MQLIQNGSGSDIAINGEGGFILPHGSSIWMSESTNWIWRGTTGVDCSSSAVFSVVQVAPSTVVIDSRDWWYTVPLTLWAVWLCWRIMFWILQRIGSTGGADVPSD